MASKPPIRVALIGLSSSAATSWAAEGHLPALLSPVGRAAFTITALCNSSVAAAHHAISTYHLPPTTKAYGSPDDLARDPDIDLVLVSTRVDKHAATALPSLRAAKAVYIEWPIASSLSDMDALIAAARASGAPALVGLQGRLAPPFVKLKSLVDSARLGPVLSSDLRAFGGTNRRDALPPSLAYFADRAVGGNPITIGFGHLIDAVQHVLGTLDPATTHALPHLQRPHVHLRDPATNATLSTIRSDVPDLLSLHGTLPASPAVAPGASLTALFRRGPPFPGAPALTWSITCERGELRLTAPAGLSLQADAYGAPVSIEMHDFATDVVERVPWAWTEEQEGMPVRARSVFAALMAWARDGKGVGIEEARGRAAQIEGWMGPV